MTLVIKGKYGDEVTSFTAIGSVLWVMSFMVASLFMATFETVIDTVFICFLIDDKITGGHPMLAPPELTEVVNDHAVKSHKMAARIKARKKHKQGEELLDVIRREEARMAGGNAAMQASH